MHLTSSTVRRLDQVLGKDAASEIYQRFSSVGGDVVHIDGNEDITGSKTFVTSIGINGVSYCWPARNAEGVLTNDGYGKLSWTVLAGVGTVTSVGLRMPEEYVVSGSPLSFSGDFVVEKVDQAANVVYAGPLDGKKSKPGFRKLTVNDVPELPIEKVHGLKKSIEDRALLSSLQEISTTVQCILEILDSKPGRDEVKDLLEVKLDAIDLLKVESEFATALAKKPDEVTLRDSIRKIEHVCSSIIDNLEERTESLAPIESPTFSGTVTTRDISIMDGSTISLGLNKGTRFGRSKHEKQAFFGSVPVSQPSGDIITALANLGLVRDPSIWISDVVGLSSRLDAIEERISSFHG